MRNFTILGFLFFLISSQVGYSQATFTSKANGNWNATGTWLLTSGTDADGIPDSNDDVIIRAHSVTVTANAACSSLVAEPLANNTTGLSTNLSATGATNLTVNSNQLLTVSGNFFAKPSDSYNHTILVNGGGSIQVGSLNIGSDIDVTTAKTTTLVCRTTANFEVLGNVNIYTNVLNSNNNRATFRHDSGTVTINGQMIMTQENAGSSTQYVSNIQTRTGVLILKNINPFVFNALGITQLSQLQPVFNGCTVVYSPLTAGLVVYNTTYRDIKIDSNFDVKSNGFTVIGNGNLYLVKGLLIGDYVLNDNVTIIRSGGAVKNNPTVSGITYNVTYAQNSSLTVSGPELLTTTQLENLTISSTNGLQCNITCTPNQLVINTATTLSGTGEIRVRNTFDVPAAVTVNIGGLITLVSNIGNTARVLPLTSNPTISGNITIERYLPNEGRKWRLLTAPLKGGSNNTVFNNWQNNGTSISDYGTDIWGPNGIPSTNGLQLITNSSHNLRRFNNSTGTWTNITNSLTETLFTSTINKGFLCFFTHPYGLATDGQGNVNSFDPHMTTTLKATGTLITGDVVYTNVPSTTYYIVGNPYASPMDFKTMLNDASNSGIGKKIWFIDPSFGLYGTYVTWDNVNGYSDYTTLRNISGSSNPSSQSTVIQSGEAFFVKAAADPSTLTIKETHKTSTNSNSIIYRTTTDVTAERLRVTLHKEENAVWNKKDAIVAGFYAGGNNAYDSNDVQKLSNPSETLSFVTETRSLSSEHRAPVQDNDFLTVKLAQMVENSTYKLKIFTEDFTYTGQAYLEDLFLNTQTPFLLDGSTFEYNFAVTTDPLSTGNRFKIVFQAALANASFPSTAFVLYPNPTRVGDGINVTSSSLSSGTYHYKLFNCLGQIITEKNFIFDNHFAHLSFQETLNQGVYYLHIYNSQNELQSSQSIFIK